MSARSDNTVPGFQKRAWGFYGYPGLNTRAVGEVRYVVGWHADQMTRLEWDVFIGGSDVWVVDLPETADTDTPGRIATTRDGEEDQTAASAELLEFIDWNDSNVRAVDTNLFVGGEGDYIEEPSGWRVVSVVEAGRKKILDAAATVVPFIWPHPADPTKPDAPLFSVLELLDELDWLNRQARAQSRQRALFSGILTTDKSLTGPVLPNGQPSTFWDQWNAMVQARTLNPDDMSPLRLAGEGEIVQNGINWTVPPLGYDAVIDRRVIAAITRLAYGLPVPPEILLGMQAQSRATAFQVEENAYRAHIEPPALMVAQVAEDALKLLLDRDDIEVIPNPTKLLARRQSVQDVKDAFDRQLATGEYVREVLGIPEDAAPDTIQQSQAVVMAIDLAKAAPSLAQSPGLDVLAQQITRLLDGADTPALNDAVASAAKDPANVAADEPVTAATTTPDLSDLLAEIDAHLSSELAGVTVMATDRARQRLGANARSRSEMVKNAKELNGLTGSQVATRLGVDGLTAAGVDLAGQIAEPIDSACRWWTRRVGEVWSQVASLIPTWSGQGAWVEESVDRLATGLATHIVETLSEPEPPPLNGGAIRAVVDASAGGGI